MSRRYSATIAIGKWICTVYRVRVRVGERT